VSLTLVWRVSRAQRSIPGSALRAARGQAKRSEVVRCRPDLGFTRDRRSNVRKSGKPDLRGPLRSGALPDQRCTAPQSSLRRLRKLVCVRCTASGTRTESTVRDRTLAQA
jgi:hypothetical protein